MKEEAAAKRESFPSCERTERTAEEFPSKTEMLKPRTIQRIDSNVLTNVDRSIVGGQLKTREKQESRDIKTAATGDNRAALRRPH